MRIIGYKGTNGPFVLANVCDGCFGKPKTELCNTFFNIFNFFEGVGEGHLLN